MSLQLCASGIPKKGTAISALSNATALAMLTGGATEPTRTEISTNFGLDDPEDITTLIPEILKALKSSSEGRKFTSANALFTDFDTVLDPPYLSILDQLDWNTHDDFFKFTRGRFILSEKENLQQREIRFDLNRLADIAAASVDATQCIAIKKYPDGTYNKAFLMTMDNGLEVVAKVPNPNAGIKHFTTASEVATMDFARRVLDTPVPRVYSWNSRADTHPVGAEFIIMEKAQVLVATTRLQKQWLRVSFSHSGGLYDSAGVQSPTAAHYIHHGHAVQDSGFSIGPATGRDWIDAKRSGLAVDRGPWPSPSQYLRAVCQRETSAIQSLTPPKQIALFCGPKLYQPDAQKKLEPLRRYQQIVEFLTPKDAGIANPRLWHNDLHGSNIFVDPQNPEKITGIIDWQSCHISPLFTHNPDPAFIDWDDLEPETLDLAPRPRLAGLSPDDKAAAVREYTLQNIFIGWRKLMHAKNPDLYRVVEFRKSPAHGLIFLAHRMFEYGEAHFMSLLVDLEHTWKDLPGVPTDTPFPFTFSEDEVRRIKADCDDAVAGTELVAQVKESLGDLWPEKGFIEHERYEECRAILDQVKSRILEGLAETEEERVELERQWPFD
ncbi:kinase-like domain-containing protein [Aspergillus crustosus]